MSDRHMQFFNAGDGKKIAYRIDDYTDPWAQADTMILLHPAMGTSERFFSWMSRLVRHFRVVRMDLRGHGASEVPPADEPLTMDCIVRDVVEMMEEIGCERAHFVGKSAGGYVSQRMAIEHPVAASVWVHSASAMTASKDWSLASARQAVST